MSRRVTRLLKRTTCRTCRAAYASTTLHERRCFVCGGEDMAHDHIRTTWPTPMDVRLADHKAVEA